MGTRKRSQRLSDWGAPPLNIDDTVIQRGYVEAYGGAFHKPFSATRTAFNAIRAPEYEILDLVRFYKGAEISGKLLWPEIMRVRLSDSVPEVAVPVAFILGRHDQQAPSALAMRYLERLKAPQKSLTWIEDAAHNPHWESYPAFEKALNKAVMKASQ